jgi:hypothetical protein
MMCYYSEDELSKRMRCVRLEPQRPKGEALGVRSSSLSLVVVYGHTGHSEYGRIP